MYSIRSEASAAPVEYLLSWSLEWEIVKERGWGEESLMVVSYTPCVRGEENLNVLCRIYENRRRLKV